MSTNQRIKQVEQVIAPAKDDRKPVLIKFIGNEVPTEWTGVLTTYRNRTCVSRSLNSQELAEYEASDLPTDVWVNIVPRPRSEAMRV
jgi:hypothetical protein